ncbi:hypothetical protein [Nesterenkonia haasae]|uniref:hypothetical protein n=1 Tax=Nesterenkonia haasae TaxID=2587813 RepID=UPI001391598D|nr:hypothetical protein [Nesterenkonia haasae]
MRSLKESIFKSPKNSNRILNVLRASDHTESRSVMNIAYGQPSLGSHSGFNR